ncbi:MULTISPECIES: fumarate reductase/succinate dehydrogenase flavoprotein subunit [unclassified Streptomyces]|jgi:succinate dehydrogenase / fumarate reductase flavoprotein subunit|uniref:fumarate reductase/succinate dehydrogenase flavoprotein subunit n=1 Tax=unclassified Streptomyces TaxID=2593676 RepID=UPI000F4FCF3C|nr:MULTISPECIES: fumarate reductase/succinate dehydrogenase flavoprotein subunit [unclassified Streptomyces]MDH6452644.1 succinate dehydrogenase / fumarate reductase flavoprotein subunit [Streptomyces sp. SAI-119]MDH6496801.1 succinate dehydrogenase / fumarate reductase flavoprotein subunit [Streptomyces sp. SAI-149]QUC56443.1 fumarate reductase/succinate dehydrogenase flavoprotein subunit [Streptomyces sp. A2-16]GLP68144.1 succinate dehydrogenase flavoprotein subunit [Streptomyces sp. TUS-ST3]
MSVVDRQEWDVVVVGAGGAGLRAAIEARERGARTAVICKSLFGKAHTVMAEGGIAASMGNANSNDNWQVHFRDTMRGGKFLNQWRMAELHAREAPDRVWELETWGALFDRTKDGRISQRNFGGHEYPRLAHVGDRTGLELIRTLQQKIVSLQQEDKKETGDYESRLKVYQECTVTRVLKDGSRVSGVFAYDRETGRFFVLEAPAVVIATGGIGKSFKVTSNSWEYTGDGHALALLAGAPLLNMEFVQFHPTGMVWPPSVKGILVTESVRGDGGVLRNSEGKRFMFDYIPDVFKEKYAQSEEEGDRWYEDPDNNRRPPELLPRDEVARAINSEVKAGRGSPHGGVFLDVSTRMPAEVIRRRLPSMYHQFKELADVDITAEPMEVGPTCHYVMGGVAVESDTAEARGVPGLFAAGEVAGGMHGSNRLGGNSLSDLLVFGRRAGWHAAEYATALAAARPPVDETQVDAAAAEALRPFSAEGAEPAVGPPENPYTLHQELQQAMNDLVGIIRREGEMEQALEKLADLRVRARRAGVEGHRQFNPGWHLALDLRNMLLVSECVARAALERTESRGGHTREDHPAMDRKWRNINLLCQLADPTGGLAATDPVRGQIDLTRETTDPIRADLLALFDKEELVKYLAEEELYE